MDATTNALNWFEIPALDIERSKKFYETIFDIQMESFSMDNMTMAMFPNAPGSGKAYGAIAKSDQHKPSMTGTLVYLNANPNMENVLSRVEAAGGKILLAKTNIGENGFMALVMDTEGNNVGVHSNE